MTCNACNSVLDKLTTVGPTTSLVVRSSPSGKFGAVEIYKCEACGTQWHRFKPERTSTGRAPLASYEECAFGLNPRYRIPAHVHDIGDEQWKMIGLATASEHR
jgi:hypothetical protein